MVVCHVKIPYMNNMSINNVKKVKYFPYQLVFVKKGKIIPKRNQLKMYDVKKD